MKLSLDALEAAARAATPGPWSTVRKQATMGMANGGRGDWASFVIRPGDSHGVAIYTPGAWDSSPETTSPDARFIAAVSPDVVQQLVTDVREAEAVVEAAIGFLLGRDWDMSPPDDCRELVDAISRWRGLK